TLPGHVISWRFAAPANDQSVAILIPDATPTNFTVIAYNLEPLPVRATMTGWNIEPGIWDIAQSTLPSRTNAFERSTSLEFIFPPRALTEITLKLKSPSTAYWQRPDLAIGPEDVEV